MPKTGETRGDGKVFLYYAKKCKNGERWVAMDHFLRIKGFDWYERRAVMDRNVADRAKRKAEAAQRKIEMDLTKEQRDNERKEKNKISSREWQARKRKENPEKYREADRRYQEKRKGDPEYIRRCREANLRCYLKKNGAKIEARKAEREARENEKLERAREKAREREAKKCERERKAAEKAAMLALRPKRVLLTPDEKRERKRQEKRNYKHVRRARMNNCEVRATPKMVAEARESAGDRCYYCGKKSELTLDHFEPLARGGEHCVSNFVFSCFSCNSRKRDLDPFDFMAANVAYGF